MTAVAVATTVERFTGDREDWPIWHARFRGALDEAGLLDLADGGETRPAAGGSRTTDALTRMSGTAEEHWKRKNRKLFSAVQRSLDDDLMMTVTGAVDDGDGKAAYDELVRLNKATTTASLNAILLQLLLLRADDEADVDRVLSRQQTLNTQLRAGKAGRELSDETMAAIVFLALPPTMEGFTDRWLDAEEPGSPGDPMTRKTLIAKLGEHRAAKASMAQRPETALHLAPAKGCDPPECPESTGDEMRRAIKDLADQVAALKAMDCKHCGGRHDSDKCWKKYPHLRPPKRWAPGGGRQDKAGVVFAAVEQQMGALSSLAGQLDKLILDSGCSITAVPDKDQLRDVRQARPGHTVQTADGKLLPVTHYGTLAATVATGKGRDRGRHATGSTTDMGRSPTELVTFEIPDCLVVPKLATSLISIMQLTKYGYKAVFSGGDSFVETPDGRKIPIGTDEKVPYLSIKITDLSYSGVDFKLLHSRYGHANLQKLRRMSQAVDGIQISGKSDDFICHDCAVGKAKRRTFRRKRERSRKYKRPGDMIHSDVSGPHIISTVDRCTYAVSFIDQVTEYTQICVLYSQKI